jgi:hypothetical protein
LVLSAASDLLLIAGTFELVKDAKNMQVAPKSKPKKFFFTWITPIFIEYWLIRNSLK